MMTVLVILALLALISAIAAAAGRCPLWVAVVLLALYCLVQQLPKGN